MKNSRISARERGLIKGAVRRVFSRSDLRKEAVESAKIEHSDPKRRTKKWIRCKECQQPTPLWLAEADHVLPIVPVDSSLEEMSWDTLVNNLWCDIKLLDILCKPCHTVRTQAQNAERRRIKKEKKKNGS